MKTLRLFAAPVTAALLAFGAPANAAQQIIDAVPSGWRMQEYTPGPIALWFTGSLPPCMNGQLLLPASSTEATRKRLWTTVQAAKLTGTRMFVYYDDQTCTISSFGVGP